MRWMSDSLWLVYCALCIWSASTQGNRAGTQTRMPGAGRWARALPFLLRPSYVRPNSLDPPLLSIPFTFWEPVQYPWIPALPDLRLPCLANHWDPSWVCQLKIFSQPKSWEFCFIESEKESEVAQSCLTLCDPIDCSLPGSSVHGIFQTIVLEWIAISFSRGSSQPRAWTQVSRIVDRYFTVWATREVFIWQEFLGLQTRKLASQVTLRELLHGGEWGARMYSSFATKDR